MTSAKVHSLWKFVSIGLPKSFSNCESCAQMKDVQTLTVTDSQGNVRSETICEDCSTYWKQFIEA